MMNKVMEFKPVDNSTIKYNEFEMTQIKDEDITLEQFLTKEEELHNELTNIKNKLVPFKRFRENYPEFFELKSEEYLIEEDLAQEVVEEANNEE